MRKQTFLRKCWNRFAGGRTPAFVLGSIFTAGLAISLTTYAVHDIQVFELDNGTAGANAIDQTSITDADASAPDDWAQNSFNGLGNCPDGLNSCGYVSGPNVNPENPGGGAFRSLFIQDPNGVNNNDTIYTGGGSKDDLDVSEWLSAYGSAPDKDDLLPVGAAAYLEDLTDDNVDNKELLIYLFGTLFAPNGDAAIGAWLFKKNIGICDDGDSKTSDPFGVVDSDGVCLPAAQQPINLHTIGDVFIVAQNSNGGRNVTMEVYKWVDENDAQGNDTSAATAAKAACTGSAGSLTAPLDNLCKVASAATAACSDGLQNDLFCGSMNYGPVNNPGTANDLPGFPTESPDDWGFQSKFPPAAGPASPAGTDGIGNDDFPPTSLLEAGLNFTRLFPTEQGCFNSFLMDTRTSTSVRAQLKDLAMGAFPLCGISVTKTGDELGKIGDPVNYTITVTNTGAITLTRDSIVDTVLGNLADPANPYVTNSTCGATLAAGESCTITATRTVLGTDPDPLPNTVDVVYSAGEDEQTASASHSVNLFQPSVDVTKTGDLLGKVGDPVDYTITVTNTSSDDSPILENGTIVDTLLGDLLAAGNSYVTSSTCGTTLAVGASCTIEATRTVLVGDPDPLPNTVTVHYNPDGFPNDITDSASHSVELFQPSVDVTKTGDTLSKVGDPVNYTITVENTSSTDSPALEGGTISDTLLGNLLDPANSYVTSSTCGATLAVGVTCTINATRTVQAGDPDPLPNTVTVSYNPVGFDNDITDSDDHSVNLFQPGVDVVKTGDELSKVTDPVNYTITVTNTGSADSPDLVNGTIVDDVLGNLLDAANPYVTSSDCTATLATGGSCTITATRIVQAGDPDPLDNTVVVHYNPDGFPNDITDSDDHSVNLFQPSVAVDKSADCEVDVIVGQTITYTYVITNTSSDDSPNLVNASIVDNVLGDLLYAANPYVTSNTCTDTLATADPDASCTITAEYVTQTAELLTNMVNVLYNPSGFPNEIRADDQQTCNVVLPAPAFVVIEKELLDAENLAFNYSATGLPDASYQLIPLFGQLPLNTNTGALFTSPFPAVGAGDSFDTTDEEIVNFETFGQTKDVSVTEGTLPAHTEFVSLTCQSVVGDSVPAVNGMTANLTLESGDVVFCRYVNQFNPGDQGCTPGFWKNHPEYWAATGYTTGQRLDTVFNFGGNFSGLADDTMMQALNYPGGNGPTGAAQILLRAAVAAVLNASHPDVEYSMTEGQVIDAVSDALADGRRSVMLALATQLDNANNGVTFDNFGTESCPLGGPLPQ